MRNRSLNFKVYFIIAMATVACILIGSLGLYQMGKIQNGLELITWTYNRNLNDTYQARSLYEEQVIQGKNLMIATTQKDLDRYYKSLKNGDADLRKAVQTLIDRFVISENIEDLKKFQDSYAQWFALIDKSYELLSAGNRDAANALALGDLRNISNTNEEYIDSVLARLMTLTNDAAVQAQNDYKSSQQMVITILLLTMFCGITTSTYILKMISRAIDNVISNLTEGALQVAGASQQIAASSEELSQASTEQAASLEETAASIEEMTSMVQKNAENAKRAYELSNNSTNSAEKGKLVVQDMIKAIDDISVSNNSIMTQVEESNKQISDIVHVIAEIGNKTKIINDIVFQTKLLSFNASVEAARAGEHGKGFAVVAEEVGNLAQMSGNAAKEISTMLESSIQKVESIVNETKQKVSSLVLEGKNRVEVGSQIAAQCGEVLEDIVKEITNVAEMSHEITIACDEQYQGVQEITKAMNQLDQVTQTNAATSEETASAAEELSSQADSLNQTIDILIDEIYGKGASQSKKVVAKGTMATGHSAPKKVVERENVVNIASVKKTATSYQPLKKAAGSFEGGVPSEDDPRFEEV